MGYFTGAHIGNRARVDFLLLFLFYHVKGCVLQYGFLDCSLFNTAFLAFILAFILSITPQIMQYLYAKWFLKGHLFKNHKKCRKVNTFSWNSNKRSENIPKKMMIRPKPLRTRKLIMLFSNVYRNMFIWVCEVSFKTVCRYMPLQMLSGSTVYLSRGIV